MNKMMLPDRFAVEATKMERLLVGCVLIDAGRCHEAMQAVSGQDFIDRDLGGLFDLLSSLVAQGQPVGDTAWLLSAISNTRPYKSLGAFGIAELSYETPHAGHSAYYADEVRRYAQRRRIRDLAMSMLESVNDGNREPSEVAQDAMGRLTIAICEVGRNDQCSASEAAQAAYHRILEAEDGQYDGIETGIRCVDQIAGRMREGELIVLAARPSIGKTSAALDTMVHATRQGKRVLFASCEMNRIALGHRLISRETGIDTETLERGILREEQRKAVELATQTLVDLPFTIWESSSPSIAQITARARVHAAKHGLDLLVIDHIGLLRASSNARSRYEAATEIAKDLKTMATSLGVPVLALCQLNREGEGEVPRLNMLRDSGAIEENADKVWFLHRDREEAKTLFLVSKFRQGQCGGTKEDALVFDRDRCSFRDANFEFAGDFR